MYPLFHRPLRNNVLWLSANPLQRHAFVNEPREDKFLMEHSFYEFFAGGGMARAGLGPGWNCLFANDFDHKKGRVYRFNWGDAQLKTADIWSLTTSDIPNTADLAWGSFPCQDLSLAGGGAGLKGDRSGTFWPFWNLMSGLIKEGRAPRKSS
jgi:DNA (cytosine-5)-methyltransferase 1